MRKKRIRLMDMLNLVWASVHDFVYLGVAALAYWLWRQPPSARATYLVVIAVVMIFGLNMIVNYRGHAHMQKRVETLEKALRKHVREGEDD